MRNRAAVLTVLGLLVLVATDLLRPTVGHGLRPYQAVVFVATLAAAIAWRRQRVLSWRRLAPEAALVALFLPTYLDHTRSFEGSDGIHYYAYLRSLMCDGDLDLANDYALLGGVDPGHRNVLSIGPAVFWAPIVVPLHVLRQVARVFGAEAPTGVEPDYQAAGCLATLAYGVAGLLVLFRVLRRQGSDGAAFWTCVVAWLGSPLRFYLSVLPGLAHGAEFFAAALVLRAFERLRDRVTARRAALAGVAVGLVFLTRSQDGLAGLLPGLWLVSRLRFPEARVAALRAIAALCVAFALAALPQVAVWQAMYHTPFLIPHKVLHGDEFMHPEHPHLVEGLISPRGGLFTSYPALGFAFAGLLLLVRRDAAYVLCVLPVLLGDWYVNASVFDWYHVRRFTGAVPLLGPGLLLVIGALTRGRLLPSALLALLAVRYDLAVDRLRDLPGDPAPVRAVVREMADALPADAYALLAPRAPRLAVRLLGGYTGEPLLAGDEKVSRIDLGTDSALLRMPERARNLSAVSGEGGVACRWVRERDARLFLPLERSEPVIVTLRAKPLEGTLEPQAMEVTWNDVPLGRRPMGPEWADYRFDVPASAVRPGTNLLAVAFDRAPIFRRVRGEGPREVRPAALQSLTLHR